MILLKHLQKFASLKIIPDTLVKCMYMYDHYVSTRNEYFIFLHKWTFLQKGLLLLFFFLPFFCVSSVQFTLKGTSKCPLRYFRSLWNINTELIQIFINYLEQFILHSDINISLYKYFFFFKNVKAKGSPYIRKSQTMMLLSSTISTMNFLSLLE